MTIHIQRNEIQVEVFEVKRVFIKCPVESVTLK